MQVSKCSGNLVERKEWRGWMIVGTLKRQEDSNGGSGHVILCILCRVLATRGQGC